MSVSDQLETMFKEEGLRNVIFFISNHPFFRSTRANKRLVKSSVWYIPGKWLSDKIYFRLSVSNGYILCMNLSWASGNVVVRIMTHEAPWQVPKVEKWALYSHCYGNSLNLAVGDEMKGSKVLKDTMDTTFKITKLVKKSPKRNAKLISLTNVVNWDTTSDGDITVLI